MYLPDITAIRFLKPSEIGEAGPSDPSDGLRHYLLATDSEVQEARSDWLATGRHVTFREELDELLGLLSPAQIEANLEKRPFPERMHLSRFTQGVPRLELRLDSRQEEIELVTEELLKTAIIEGRLDLYRTLPGDGTSIWTGERSALYMFEKAQRLGSVFTQEWKGEGYSRFFLDIREAIQRLLTQNASSLDFPNAPVQLKSYRDRNPFFRTLDDFLTTSGAEVQQLVAEAGVDWSRWCQAGHGLRARLGLEKIYF